MFIKKLKFLQKGGVHFKVSSIFLKTLRLNIKEKYKELTIDDALDFVEYILSCSNKIFELRRVYQLAQFRLKFFPVEIDEKNKNDYNDKILEILLLFNEIKKFTF